MTNREFFNAVIANEISAEVIAHAEKSLASLDARNAKRAERPSRKAEANAPIIASLSALLTSEPRLASELAAEVGISTQKASALLKQIENISVTDVKVKGKGTQKGYFLAE